MTGGSIKVDLYYDQESKGKPIQSANGGETIKVRNLPKNITNVYVKVTGLQYSYFNLLIYEPSNQIMLSEGVPLIAEAAEKKGKSVSFLIALPEFDESIKVKTPV